VARSVATIDPLHLAGIRQIFGTAPEKATAESSQQIGRDERSAQRAQAETTGNRERLQVRGPYRLVRHPLYFGWLLMVFGAAHMTGDRLAFAVLTTAYLVMAIPWEERSLTAAFGEEYEQYKTAVKWRMVPYLY
jgi:protein-S-isoprenylcysteine O-methyltransferase Ste14